MPYSTPQDVRNALVPNGSSTTPGGTAAELGDAQIADAIIEADSTIDSYIGQRYVTPVAADPATQQTPSSVRYLSRDIAAYLITLTWRRSKDPLDTDPVVRRYNAAIAYLKAVSAGSINMPGLADNTGDSATGEAGEPFNPAVSNLFCNDFDLRAPLANWPRFGDSIP